MSRSLRPPRRCINLLLAAAMGLSGTVPVASQMVGTAFPNNQAAGRNSAQSADETNVSGAPPNESGQAVPAYLNPTAPPPSCGGTLPGTPVRLRRQARCRQRRRRSDSRFEPARTAGKSTKRRSRHPWVIGCRPLRRENSRNMRRRYWEGRSRASERPCCCLPHAISRPPPPRRCRPIIA